MKEEILSCIYVIIGLYAFYLNLLIANAIVDIFEPYFGSFSIVFGFSSFFGILAITIYASVCRDEVKDFKELEKKYDELKREYNILKSNIPKYEHEAHRRNEIIAAINKKNFLLQKENNTLHETCNKYHQELLNVKMNKLSKINSYEGNQWD